MFTQCCISEQTNYAQQISGVIKCEGNLIFSDDELKYFKAYIESVNPKIVKEEEKLLF